MAWKSKPSVIRATASLFVLAFLVLAGGVAAEERDDRNLLRPSSGDPYVFIIFDSSGSMHWTPACTVADAATDIDPYVNQCDSVCPFGDPTDVNNTLCKQVCPNWGCIEYDFALPPIFEEIIIDNSDTSRVTFTGSWSTSSTGTPWLTNFRHDNNTGKGNKTARFTPDIQIAASYEVYLWWSSDALGRRATNVPVDITHAGGMTTLTVNQRVGGNGWFLLGEFDFDEGTGGNLLIRNAGTDNIVVADAVRFLATRKPDPPPPCNKFGYRCQQPQCPTGDCFAPLNSDDPTSKFFQAKAALHEVLDQVSNVRVGFATYEQDQARVKVKHWLYRVAATKPDGTAQSQLQIPLGDVDGNGTQDFYAFPEIGTTDVFGTSDSFGTHPTYVPVDEGWACRSGDTVGCRNRDGREAASSFDPADLGDAYEVLRTHRFPKLGRTRSYQSHVVLRANNSDSQIYRVTYSHVSGVYGDASLAVSVRLYKCGNPASYGDGNELTSDGDNTDEVDVCRDNIATTVGSAVTVYYELVSDFLPWDSGAAGRTPPEVGFFDQATSDIVAGNACDGWDPNDDTGAAPGGADDDLFRSYSVRWPTATDVLGTTYVPATDVFNIGDVIPLDWRNPAEAGYVDRIAAIQQRLAPNTVGSPSADPDFRNATYFNDDVLIGDDPTNTSNRKLRLKNESQRPILGTGSTPLGGSMFDFEEWFSDWSGLAATGGDPSWACRKKYLLVITDGDDTCYSNSNPNDPCDVAQTLNETYNVQTFVVGFGLANGSSLECMAENGGTGDPIYPRNKQELVDALTNIFGEIQVDSRTFASASIPAVQSAAADKIYLSSFTPVDKDEPIWPGEVNVFRKPLPLNDNNEPDTSRKCIDSGVERDSGCHLYEIGEVLLTQAPSQSEVDESPPVLKIGTALDERRVFYGKSNPRIAIPDPPTDPPPTLEPRLHPNPLRLFDLATTYEDAVDLGEVLAKPSFAPSDPTNQAKSTEEYNDETLPIFKQVLKIKERTVIDSDGGIEDFTWVLGDIFHANPLVVSTPNEFTYFAADLCGFDLPDDAPANNCTPSSELTKPEDGYKLGYRQFVRRNVWRRRMLFVAANDGQLHAFDAGIHRVINVAGTDVHLFDDGTGKELFSYMPRLTMPVVRLQGTDNFPLEADRTGPHVFSLDTSLAQGDVFIDPAPVTGRARATPDHAIDDVITPAAKDREWRTVLVGGMREGGDVFDSADDNDNVISGYYALDVTEPDVLDPSKFRTEATDPLTNEPFSGQRVEPIYPTPADQVLPSCLAVDSNKDQDVDSRCQTLARENVPFPAELWTFDDTFFYESADPALRGAWSFDEEIDDNVTAVPDAIWGCPIDTVADGKPDGNCYPDLGETWSRPVIGQVRICVSDSAGATPTKCAATFDPDEPEANDEVTTRHVAIFAGGMDPIQAHRYNLDGWGSNRGNWLYMVDVETGKVIYKRALVPPPGSPVHFGAAPADPAVLDVNRDGILDVVYVGTTAGYLYKVDLGALGGATGDQVPAIVTTTLDAHSVLVRPGGDGDSPQVRFPLLVPAVKINVERVVDAAWEPFPILDVGGSGTARRQIYFAPTAFFIRERNQYALAFGTGDRDDLWERLDDVGGRFFTIVDEDFTRAQFTAGTLPLDSSDYASIGFDSALVSQDFLRAPDTGKHPGWVMSLSGANYRITSQAFVISGILIFSVYDPNVVPDITGDQLCAYSGESLSFVVFAENANAVAPLSDPNSTSPLTGKDRFRRIGDFTTAPFIDRTASKNPDQGGSAGNNITRVQAELQAKLREAIKSRYPRGSRFNDAYNILIGAFESSTGAQVYATIPVAIFPSDWKEE